MSKGGQPPSGLSGHRNKSYLFQPWQRGKHNIYKQASKEQICLLEMKTEQSWLVYFHVNIYISPA